ncbi:MAG: tetratricopeptide repeat protein [Terriglobia bacterium]
MSRDLFDEERRMDRLARLKGLVEENPQDRFARYGLAMELSSQGRLEESVGEFRALISLDPGYVASYFQAGQTLEKLYRVEEAREVYRKGMEVAERRGDTKTRGELESALNLLD